MIRVLRRTVVRQPGQKPCSESSGFWTDGFHTGCRNVSHKQQSSQDANQPDDLPQLRYVTPGFKPFSHLVISTSNNHRLESAGLNALEELLRCWECTEKIVKPACVF